MQFTALVRISRRDPKFFLRLADNTSLRGLTWLELSPNSVDLSGTETPLFMDHEDFRGLPHKAKRRPCIWLPTYPIEGRGNRAIHEPQHLVASR